MKSKRSIAKILTLFILATALLPACKYEDVHPLNNYPDAKIYMTTASSIYVINDVPVPPVNGAPGTGTYRFTTDLTTGKFNVPLSVYRSGVGIDGDVSANIRANTDTINKLVANGSLNGVTILPADKYVLPGSATVQGGKDNAPFNVAIDLNYLKANLDKVFAFAVTISSSQVTVNSKLNTTVITIDAKLLKSVPNFSVSVNAKAASFANTSLYSTGYLWDFGDGSPTSTMRVPPVHTYATSGTFNVTLTTTGVTGATDATSKSMNVVIP